MTWHRFFTVLSYLDGNQLLAHTLSASFVKTTERCKWSMLNVENSPWVQMPFLFMHTIDLLRPQVLILFSIWVTDAIIKERWSLVLPEPKCMDIQSHILRFIRSSSYLFSRDVFEGWLSLKITEYRTVRSSASRSLSSLWRFVTKPQFYFSNQRVVYGKTSPKHTWRRYHPLASHNVF